MFSTDLFGVKIPTLFKYDEICLGDLRKYVCICNNIECFRFEITCVGDVVIMDFKGIPDLECYNTTSIYIGDVAEMGPVINAVEKIVIAILSVRKFFSMSQA